VRVFHPASEEPRDGIDVAPVEGLERRGISIEKERRKVERLTASGGSCAP
jgi:hypothetical protein